jgi:hypothetical protein
MKRTKTSPGTSCRQGFVLQQFQALPCLLLVIIAIRHVIAESQTIGIWLRRKSDVGSFMRNSQQICSVISFVPICTKGIFVQNTADKIAK